MYENAYDVSKVLSRATISDLRRGPEETRVKNCRPFCKKCFFRIQKNTQKNREFSAVPQMINGRPLIHLMVLTKRKERKMDRPFTLARPSSIKLNKTITISKQFHLSFKQLIGFMAMILSTASAVNIVVNTCKQKSRQV